MNQIEMPYLPFIKQTALFQPLDDQQLVEVARRLNPRRYRAGTIIFHQGDPGECLYLLVSGRVRISLVHPDGREVALRIYSCGDSFGELSVLDRQQRSATATAMEDVTTLTLDRSAFQELLRENFVLVEHIMALLAERLRYTTDYSRQMAFLTVPGRVATRLVQLANEDGGCPPVRLQLTQQALAEFTSTTREWVNRVLNNFADLRLIRLDRGAIMILDLPGLQRMIA